VVGERLSIKILAEKQENDFTRFWIYLFIYFFSKLDILQYRGVWSTLWEKRREFGDELIIGVICHLLV